MTKATTGYRFRDFKHEYEERFADAETRDAAMDAYIGHSISRYRSTYRIDPGDTQWRG